MINSLRELWKAVRKDKRYLILLVLFVLLLQSGGRITGEPGIEEKAVSNPVWQAEYELTSKKPLVELSEALASKPGDYYRLVLGVQDITAAMDQGVQQVKDDEIVHYLRVLARSRAGQIMEVGRIKLPQSREIKEIIFRTDGFYSDLVFENEVANRNADIFTNVISLTRLNISAEEEVKLLGPTLIGETDTSSTWTGMSDKNTSGIYDFNKKGELVGQVFKATADKVATAELKLEFIGNGGLGTYELGLYNANRSGGRFIVNDDPIVTVPFDAIMARTKYLSLYQPGVYIFPLPANVIKGNYYFVGIRNKANFNKRNHLRFDGVTSTKAYSEGVGLANVTSSDSQEIGTLYFRINYAIPKYIDEGAMAPNSVIQDLGGGIGQYVFTTRSNFLGKLATHDMETNTVTYEMTTKFPIQKLSLEASIEGDEGSNPPAYRLEYSLDGNEWRKVELGGRTALYATNVRQVINVSDDGKKLYIRVSAVDPLRAIHITDLVVNADLLMR